MPGDRSMSDALGGGEAKAPAVTPRSMPGAPSTAPPDVGESMGEGDAAPPPEAPPVKVVDPAEAETAKPETAKPEAPSIVDRLFAGKGELPVWAQELVAEQETAEFSFTDEEIERLPLEAKKLVALALRRGQAAKAELEADLAAREALSKAAVERELAAKKLESESFKWVRDPKLLEVVQGLEKEGDSRSPGEQIAAFFKALQEADQRLTQARAQAEAEAKYNADRAALEAYIGEHADDFQNEKIRGAIKEIVQRTEGKITAQEAHKFVMGQLALEGAQDQAAARAEARRRLAPSGRTANEIPEMPEHIRGNTDAELRWYAANPEAEKRDLARLETALAYKPRTRRG